MRSKLTEQKHANTERTRTWYRFTKALTQIVKLRNYFLL